MIKEPVTVIIPALNSPYLTELVQVLLSQNYQGHINILIVGQDNTGTFEKLRDQVRIIETATPVNAAVARNVGIEHCKTDLILFVDSDCLPETNWVDKIVSKLKGGWDVVGGSVKLEKNNYLTLVYNLSMLHEFLTYQNEKKVRYLPTINLGVTRSVIDSVGVMNELLARSQDLEWTLRMSEHEIKMVFYPEAVIAHKPVLSGFGTVWKQFSRSGFFSVQVRKKYKNSTKKLFYKIAWFWVVFSPIISFVTTLNIFIKTPQVWRYVYTFPAIYLTKIAWCIGAAKGIRSEELI